VLCWKKEVLQEKLLCWSAARLVSSATWWLGACCVCTLHNVWVAFVEFGVVHMAPHALLGRQHAAQRTPVLHGCATAPVSTEFAVCMTGVSENDGWQVHRSWLQPFSWCCGFTTLVSDVVWCCGFTTLVSDVVTPCLICMLPLAGHYTRGTQYGPLLHPGFCWLEKYIVWWWYSSRVRLAPFALGGDMTWFLSSQQFVCCSICRHAAGFTKSIGAGWQTVQC
jgi:hypothetical protein